MKVIGKKVILTKKEIREAILRNKKTKEFLDTHKKEMENPLRSIVLLMKYLESEGWDFSKIGKSAMPKHLRNVPEHPYFYVDDNGRIVYL